MRKILTLLAVLLLCGAILICSCSKENTSEAVGKCHITVDCTRALSSGQLSPDLLQILPKDGLILDTDFHFSENDSAFSVLKNQLKENKIHLDFEDSVYGAYIKGIANLYNGTCGEMSGWMLVVNGQMAEVGASGYKVNDGDEIAFVYSLSFGEDM